LTIAELLSGGTPRTKVPEYWNGSVRWVSAKDVRSAQGTFLLDTERTITQKGVENSSTNILPELTTIVTARGTVGSYCLLAEPMAMNQTNYGLKARREDADYFVFFALGNMVSQLKQRAYGTIFDTVTTRTFETSQIVVPGDAVLTEFDRRIRPLMEKIRENLRQARTLASIRDTLLPKLISGELRVPDAERIVGRCA
jgi:type I restriction enzyme S subunit